MEMDVAVRTSETSVDKHFTRQYIPEDNSEHHTRCHENLKSHIVNKRLHYASANHDEITVTGLADFQY